MGIGAAALVASTALDVYARQKKCFLGARPDDCGMTPYDDRLYGTGYAIGGTSIAIGAGLTISAAAGHKQQEKNLRGSPCQSGSL